MHAYPTFGHLPVAEVDTTLVLKALKPIWHTIPETASRVRGRVEAVLDWARVRGYRDGPNPALWRGHLAHLLPARAKVQKVQHHAALPYAEMGAFMADMRKRDALAARALEFMILTAGRTGEVLGATWDEIDMAAAVWTIPGARKGRPLSNMAALMLLRRMERGDLTAHGFRSTFRDWTAEQTAFPGEVAETALAHVVGDKVEAAYRRGDLFEKRRKLMEAWADYCDRPAVEPGQVVPIRAGL